MKIGSRKLIAAVGAIAITGLAVVAWSFWGTDGLIAVLLATVAAATAMLGWLIVDSRRQLAALLADVKSLLISPSTDTSDSVQAERLLRAVQAGIERTNATVESFLSEQMQRDAVDPTLVDRPTRESASDAG